MRLQYDGAGLMFAEALRTPAFDGLFAGVTWLGSLWVLIPLALGCAGVLWVRGRPVEGALLIASLSGAALSAHLGKLAFARTRPDLYPALVEMPVSWSFPSSHAAQSTAFFLSLWLLSRRIAPRWAMFTAALAVAAVVAVALSRIYLQVHFPSDVLAGLFLGGLWGSLCVGVMASRGAGCR